MVPFRFFINYIEFLLYNMMGYGDVAIYSIDEVREFCKKANLEVETLEQQGMFRLHLVAIKKIN